MTNTKKESSSSSKTQYDDFADAFVFWERLANWRHQVCNNQHQVSSAKVVEECLRQQHQNLTCHELSDRWKLDRFGSSFLLCICCTKLAVWSPTKLVTDFTLALKLSKISACLATFMPAASRAILMLWSVCRSFITVTFPDGTALEKESDSWRQTSSWRRRISQLPNQQPDPKPPNHARVQGEGPLTPAIFV